MEFLASFVLDRIRIGLQVVDMLAQAVIFLLQLLHLLLEDFGFFPLVGEGGEAVVAKDDAVRHHEREGSRCHGCRATAPQVDAIFRCTGKFRQFAGKLRFLRGDSQVRASRRVCELSVLLQYRAFPGGFGSGSCGRNQTRRQMFAKRERGGKVRFAPLALVF